MADIDADLIVAALAEKYIAGATAVVLASPPEGPVWGVLVPSRRVFAAWTVLREAMPRTGGWPIVIGNVPRLPSLDRDARPVETILASAAEVDPREWARQRAGEDPDRFASPSGDWPATVRHGEAFRVLSELGRQAEPAVIALAPTALPHQVPAHLRFGGWSDCPPPEVHVAVFREWHERFGAEPVVMTKDTLELLVRRPVSSREEALELARFQRPYDGNLVDQGVDSVEVLAARLLGNPRWFFRWD